MVECLTGLRDYFSCLWFCEGTSSIHNVFPITIAPGDLFLLFIFKSTIRMIDVIWMMCFYLREAEMWILLSGENIFKLRYSWRIKIAYFYGVQYVLILYILWKIRWLGQNNIYIYHHIYLEFLLVRTLKISFLANFKESNTLKFVRLYSQSPKLIILSWWVLYPLTNSFAIPGFWEP